MTRELDEDELIDRWTLVGDEPGLVATKRGAAKIGFALMLRFYTEKGRFPRGRSEIHEDAVDYVARQIGVDRFLEEVTTQPGLVVTLMNWASGLAVGARVWR